MTEQFWTMEEEWVFTAAEEWFAEKAKETEEKT